MHCGESWGLKKIGCVLSYDVSNNVLCAVQVTCLKRNRNLHMHSYLFVILIENPNSPPRSEKTLVVTILES